MGDKLASYELQGPVALVTIDHPPMNALDVPTKLAIKAVFDELDQRRDEMRAVVLTGAGDKAFAGGADIKTFLELTPETAKRRLMLTHAIYAQIEGFVWPVIAAIKGYCLGGGLELALACDIRYAGEKAKLGFPEVNLSVFPGNGGIARGPHLMSLGKFKELVFSGALISAGEAMGYGLIEKVAPDDQVLEAALELAGRIAQKGPLGLMAAKKAINRCRDLAMLDRLELESDLWARLTASEDMKEGARAFMEKRKPDYRCR
ncbi:MAG: enoyl-CoA hydratase-related protein [Pseudomonadota bacterium]